MEEGDHLEDPGVKGYILKEIPNEENEIQDRNKWRVFVDFV
jgi:hypothetical protein